jgi:hypothetical protein
MGNEVDEDLIEATIRRVAEAQAARAQSGAPAEAEGQLPASDAPVGELASPEEDAIEATIRRVAEANAARQQAVSASEPEPEGYAPELPANPDVIPDEDAIEATIRRAAETNAARQQSEAPAAGAPLSFATAAPPEDDDPIEATIRRVAAERAAREAELASAPAASADPVHDAIAHAEATIEQADDEVASVPEMPLLHLVPPPPRSVSEHEALASSSQSDSGASSAYGRPRLVANGDVEGLASAVSNTDVNVLRAELHTIASQVEELAARVHALGAKIGGIAVGSNDASADSVISTPPKNFEDDWDDTPQLPRIPLGGPPRPAIMRDPSPMTATAQHLVEDASPTHDDESRLAPMAERTPLPPRAEPAFDPPRPVSPPEPEAKRGFDLLPKTYRITVEDKRRGVDLVPLHRALLGMDGVKDMSLLSYSNGVAIVAVETANGIDPDALNRSVSRAMARAVKVEVHNDTTMVVKVAED